MRTKIGFGVFNWELYKGVALRSQPLTFIYTIHYYYELDVYTIVLHTLGSQFNLF